MRQKLLFALLVASATIGTTQTLAQQNKFFASKPKTVKFNKLTYDRYEDKYDTAYYELKIGSHNEPYLIFSKFNENIKEKVYTEVRYGIDSLYIVDSFQSSKPEIKIARKFNSYSKYLLNQQYIDSIDNCRAALKHKIESIYGEELDLSMFSRYSDDELLAVWLRMIYNKPEILQNNKGKLLYDYLDQYCKIKSPSSEPGISVRNDESRKMTISLTKKNVINYSQEGRGDNYNDLYKGKITLDNQNRIKQIKHKESNRKENYTYTYDNLGNLQSINNVSKYKSEYDKSEYENITRYQYTNIENKTEINMAFLLDVISANYYTGHLEDLIKYLMINTHSRYLPSAVIYESEKKGKISESSRVTFDWEIDNNGMPQKVTVKNINDANTFVKQMKVMGLKDAVNIKDPDTFSFEFIW